MWSILHNGLDAVLTQNRVVGGWSPEGAGSSGLLRAHDLREDEDEEDEELPPSASLCQLLPDATTSDLPAQ